MKLKKKIEDNFLLSLFISAKILNGLNGILRGLGETDS
jgi:hypothetical protein